MDIIFHDGIKEPIDVERMSEFDIQSVLDQLFDSRTDIDSASVLEELGPWVLDYTNLHDWSENIPDVQKNGSRLFQLWAENTSTSRIIGVTKGHFVLVPFTLSSSAMKDYYALEATPPYYPMAIITSLRSALREPEDLDEFLKALFEAVSQNWKERRQEAIETLGKETELWKRYVYCFEDIIHFTVLCPSIHRRLIDALKRQGQRITGVMQLLASSSPSYDRVAIEHHMKKARKLIDESELE